MKQIQKISNILLFSCLFLKSDIYVRPYAWFEDHQTAGCGPLVVHGPQVPLRSAAI